MSLRTIVRSTTTLLPPALAAVAVLAGCRPSMRADILLSDVSVVDVRAGVVLPHRDVVIQGDTITRVLPHGSRSVAARALVDGRGRYVMPGLWDMHAHIRSYDAADILPMFILHGVTGIRDLGLTRFASIQQWRREIANGSMVGPRIISSGVIIEGAEPVFPSSPSITSSSEIAPKLDTLVGQGIGVVKLFHNLPGPVFTDLIAYARGKGLPTAGHIPEDWDEIEAARSGLGSIEHFWGLDRTLSFREGRLDSAEVIRLAEALTANHPRSGRKPAPPRTASPRYQLAASALGIEPVLLSANYGSGRAGDGLRTVIR